MMTKQRKAKIFYVAYSAVVSTAIALVVGGLTSLFNDNIAIIMFGMVFGFVFSELLERGSKQMPW